MSKKTIFKMRKFDIVCGHEQDARASWEYSSARNYGNNDHTVLEIDLN